MTRSETKLPTVDRIVTSVPSPPSKLMPSSTVFDSKGRPQLDVIGPHLISEGRLTEEAILRIINDCSAILKSEKTMLELEAPITNKLCLYMKVIDKSKMNIKTKGSL
ncbi:Serine/threonine-protein phosphatase 2B catalytic subunit 3 [Schistosoma haematobium]|uniref:Serine/threonine-protein phosphatase 2B catalytic subunit 3 n=1 Tax=Schistosoma haematobium TaxID=6185 RepID=A0A922IK10_SCHHA|nr:Serine/threonine-protein phosphatase 2B catalytic subunit 3 [Schistosoma haematobium]KAH9581210.1 Serine/threonine-protein phosphatase 2B catalytic subunit 3 [Schistosoma haematobium]